MRRILALALLLFCTQTSRADSLGMYCAGACTGTDGRPDLHLLTSDLAPTEEEARFLVATELKDREPDSMQRLCKKGYQIFQCQEIFEEAKPVECAAICAVSDTTMSTRHVATGRNELEAFVKAVHKTVLYNTCPQGLAKLYCREKPTAL